MWVTCTHARTVIRTLSLCPAWPSCLALSCAYVLSRAPVCMFVYALSFSPVVMFVHAHPFFFFFLSLSHTLSHPHTHTLSLSLSAVSAHTTEGVSNTESFRTVINIDRFWARVETVSTIHVRNGMDTHT